MKKIFTIGFAICLMSSLSAQVKNRFEEKKENTQKTEERSAGEKLERRELPADGRKSSASAEDDEAGFWDRLVYGGNVSLSFGTYTSIYVAPSVGYKVTDNFILGTGGIYSYVSYNLYNNNQLDTTLKFSMYGPKFFANYIIGDMFYAGAQFEYLNHDIPRYDPAGFVTDFRRDWTPVLFLEGGYTQSIGKKGYVQLGLRYNVLHGPESPYGSSWFPVIGFFF